MSRAETITLSDLAKQVSTRFGMPRDAKEVEGIARVFIEVLKANTRRGKRIDIRNFGTFSVKPQNARIRHNPRTFEKVLIPARSVVKFKPASTWAEDVSKDL